MTDLTQALAKWTVTRSGRRTGSRAAILVGLLAVAVVTAIPAQPAAAEVVPGPPTATFPPIISFTQQDLDGDGAPDLAVIETSYISPTDWVYVYDQGNDMRWSDDWHTGTDFINDVWLFSPEFTETVRVALRFSHDGEEYVADLFHDVDGDRLVSHQISADGQVQILEAALPAVHFHAQAPWILPDGSVNYVLSYETYSVASATASIGGFTLFPRDGRIHTSGELVDQNGDGVVDYELMNSYPNLPQEWFYPRTSLNIHSDNDQFGFENAIFWPYLGGLRWSPWSESQTLRSPGDHYPPVIVEWLLGRVDAVGAFMPLWGGDRLRFNSITQLTKNEVNTLYFERFGHFCFSDSEDPNLIIRWDQTQNFEIGANGRDYYQVEINWQREETGPLTWDYKLELAGISPPPSTTIDFQDFSVHEIPLAEWPYWFTSQNWAFASFIDTEGAGYLTNETIYEWNSIEGTVINVQTGETAEGASYGQKQYLAGNTTASPEQFYTEIREGFRGEYADLLNNQARLYFSPVDGKLHLLHASHGVWNLGGGREIRYENLGGDAINRWTLRENEEEVSSLYTPPGYLIYSGPEGVRIVRADVPEALYTTLPPRNREEWLLFDQDLRTHARDFAPEDFLGMMAQFDGPTWQMTEASLRDFRLTEDGFRAVLELGDDFAQQDTAFFPDAPPDLAAGQYVITWDGEAFSFAPLTPPQFSIAANQVRFSADEIVALEAVTISLTIQNQGREDAHNTAVRLYAQQGDEEYRVANTQITLLGESEQTLYLQWLPKNAGEWTLFVELEPDAPKNEITMSPEELAAIMNGVYPETSVTADESATSGHGSASPTRRPARLVLPPVFAQPDPAVPWTEFLSLDGELADQGYPVLIMMGALALAALVLMVLIMRSPEVEE